MLSGSWAMLAVLLATVAAGRHKLRTAAAPARPPRRAGRVLRPRDPSCAPQGQLIRLHLQPEQSPYTGCLVTSALRLTVRSATRVSQERH